MNAKHRQSQPWSSYDHELLDPIGELAYHYFWAANRISPFDIPTWDAPGRWSVTCNFSTGFTMVSQSLEAWSNADQDALDEIEAAHSAVGGIGPGRRYTTQQLNHAYAVLLASRFQGFCRNLHSECVDHLMTWLSPPLNVHDIVRAEFTRDRRIDIGNPRPENILADFRRLGVHIGNELEHFNTRHVQEKVLLVELNKWRNAIAHNDFSKMGGTTSLGIQEIRRWRRACRGLAKGFDRVMRTYLYNLSGSYPW